MTKMMTMIHRRAFSMSHLASAETWASGQLEQDVIWMSHCQAAAPTPALPPRGGREQNCAPSLPSPSGGGVGGGVRLANANLKSSRASREPATSLGPRFRGDERGKR